MTLLIRYVHCKETFGIPGPTQPFNYKLYFLLPVTYNLYFFESKEKKITLRSKKTCRINFFGRVLSF